MSEPGTIHDDISYMRRLAESGRKGPVLGGAFLAAAGIVFGITSFVGWAGMEGVLPIRGWHQLYLWLGAFGVFAVVWLALFLRKRPHGAAATASTATFGTVWSACGIGVMVAFGTTMLISRVIGSNIVLNAYIPIIYAFYGTAWFASAALARQRWMFLAAAGSFVFAFVVALLAENTLQTPAMGVGLLLLLTVPGLKLMSSEAH